jgi:hypothetical protein
VAFLDRLCVEHNADVIVGTHSGIHWQRELPAGGRYINVGVLGRPENDGQTCVWYAIVRTGTDADPQSTHQLNGGVSVSVDFISVEYDHQRLAMEMRQESLPQEFIDTVLNGWWTTCLEILPSRERRAGQY